MKNERKMKRNEEQAWKEEMVEEKEVWNEERKEAWRKLWRNYIPEECVWKKWSVEE